jgi:hypothetical protein
VANMRSCLRLSCIVQGYDSRATLYALRARVDGNVAARET